MTERQHTEHALDEALRAIADEDASLGASPAVEAHLRAELRSVAAARRARAWRVVGGLAAAAVLVAAIAIPMWRARGTPAVQDPGANTRTAARREVATAFVPLAFSDVPIGGGHIVRMEMPRASLALLGLMPVDSVGAVQSGTVIADVIVGDDGLARAVRFVHRSKRKEP
jgi:hypothetical protein